MNTVVEEAVVLRRLNYGEADRIVTLLTASHGKISAIAKGVRRPKSKLAGGIEIFAINSISFINSKNELKTLVSASPKENFDVIATDLTLAQVAYDILKFTHQYTEVVCEDSYYQICTEALRGLQQHVAPRLVAVWFGVCVLQVSGHGLNLHSTTSGEPLDQSASYSFDYQDMAFKQDPNGRYTSQHIKLLRLCGQVRLQKLQAIQNVAEIASELVQIITDSVRYNSQFGEK